MKQLIKKLLRENLTFMDPHMKEFLEQVKSTMPDKYEYFAKTIDELGLDKAIADFNKITNTKRKKPKDKVEYGGYEYGLNQYTKGLTGYGFTIYKNGKSLVSTRGPVGSFDKATSEAKADIDRRNDK